MYDNGFKSCLIEITLTTGLPKKECQERYGAPILEAVSEHLCITQSRQTDVIHVDNSFPKEITGETGIYKAVVDIKGHHYDTEAFMAQISALIEPITKTPVTFHHEGRVHRKSYYEASRPGRGGIGTQGPSCHFV